MRKLRCTLSGSLNRSLSDIRAVAKHCQKLGIEVLSPSISSKKREIRGFVILNGDRGGPRAVEEGHLRAIRNSDFLYVVNPSGYIGASAVLEIGYAIASSIPAFCSETPSEFILQLFTHTEPSLSRIMRKLAAASLPPVPRGASLSELQSYVRRMVRARGFEEESVRDVVLLLLEELGELAKAIRREVGLKVHISKRVIPRRVSAELADCLIYLLDIGNIVNVELADALRMKEASNKRRRWVLP